MANQYFRSLICSNLQILSDAVALLDNLSTEHYVEAQRPLFESSIGKHVRHIADHYLCFQRDFASGLIDYNHRARDMSLETNRQHACSTLQALKLFIASLDGSVNLNASVNVVLCPDVDVNKPIAKSSVERELQFLQDHSIHHYALIATMLKLLGRTVNPSFGVAPSTLHYEASSQ